MTEPERAAPTGRHAVAPRRRLGWALTAALVLALFVAAGAAATAPRTRASVPVVVEPTAPAPETLAIATPDPAPPAPEEAPVVAPTPNVEPATPTAARVLERLRAIEASARVTRYVHVLHVDVEAESYLWDCSGMVSWLLRHESRRHFLAVGSRRPFARDFADLVEHSSTLYARRGWRRVLRLEDARAGDVFSWHLEQNEMVTGHVGFFVEAPMPVPGHERTFSVRVADSTKSGHGASDTRVLAGDLDGGLGEGTMVFVTDEMGRGRGYVWNGDVDAEPTRTRIWVGRLE